MSDTHGVSSGRLGPVRGEPPHGATKTPTGKMIIPTGTEYVITQGVVHPPAVLTNAVPTLGPEPGKVPSPTLRRDDAQPIQQEHDLKKIVSQLSWFTQVLVWLTILTPKEAVQKNVREQITKLAAEPLTPSTRDSTREKFLTILSSSNLSFVDVQNELDGKQHKLIRATSTFKVDNITSWVQEWGHMQPMLTDLNGLTSLDETEGKERFHKIIDQAIQSGRSPSDIATALHISHQSLGAKFTATVQEWAQEQKDIKMLCVLLHEAVDGTESLSKTITKVLGEKNPQKQLAIVHSLVEGLVEGMIELEKSSPLGSEEKTLWKQRIETVYRSYLYMASGLNTSSEKDKTYISEAEDSSNAFSRLKEKINISPTEQQLLTKLRETLKVSKEQLVFSLLAHLNEPTGGPEGWPEDIAINAYPWHMDKKNNPQPQLDALVTKFFPPS